MIDTHSHLYGEEFETDIDEVLARAAANGVEKIFLPNINADTIEPMKALAKKHPGFLYPMIGLHPEDVGDNWKVVLEVMEKELAQPENPYIAVGEVGLDFYWDQSRRNEQMEAFATQVEWAQRYDLPLMIHTREAHREVVDILKQRHPQKPLTGVFHCFGGTEEEAAELLQFPGFMLGIGGILTFKKSTLPEVLRKVVPLSRIVIETDAPYLAPVPHRGKRNESAFISCVITHLASIYGLQEEEVGQATSANALRTFPKAQ